jgi:transcriptional regulator with XRE-family HTH domain
MGLQIRELRKQLGLSQKRLAILAGLSLENLRDIESGVREVAHEDVERAFQVLLTGDSLSVK